MTVYRVEPNIATYTDGDDGTYGSFTGTSSASHEILPIEIVGTIVRLTAAARGRLLSGSGEWVISLYVPPVYAPPSGEWYRYSSTVNDIYTPFSSSSFTWHYEQTTDAAEIAALNPEGQRAALADGSAMFSIENFSTDFQLSEAYIEIETSGGATSAPPCRLFPRADRLGNSPRLFPPPDTRQARNRLNGYY